MGIKCKEKNALKIMFQVDQNFVQETHANCKKKIFYNSKLLISNINLI